ncbi:MAG: hypothetical protein LBU81_05310 [Methanosarcinales archaeon]|jgi:hypothetical protein|nr:hypothetical protein [Methanosarcinales archaeon]
MQTLDYEEYIQKFDEYYENVVKKEKPEESKKKLIDSGVLDENGQKIIRHGVQW